MTKRLHDDDDVPPAKIVNTWQSLIVDAAHLPTQDAAHFHCLTRWPYSRLCPPTGAAVDFSCINHDVLSLVEQQTTGAPMFLLAGGFGKSGNLCDAVWLIDLGSVQQQWRQMSPLINGPLSGHDSCLWRGQPLVVGGCGSKGNPGFGSQHCRSYSCRDNLWSSAPSLKQALSDHSVVCVGDSVFTCGGTLCCSAVDSLEVLNRSGSWVVGPPLSTARSSHCASTIGGPGDAPLATGFLVVGGCSDGYTSLHSACKYDIASEQWTSVSDMIEADSDFCAVTLADHCVYVLGYEELQCYDYRADGWQLRSPMLDPVMCHTAMRLDEHVIVVMGGMRNDFEHINMCQVYDNRADAWRDEERWQLPEALCCHATVLMNCHGSGSL